MEAARQAATASPVKAATPAERLQIVTKDPCAILPNKLTFFALPGELRNDIYRLAFEKEYQRVPLNAEYRNKPEAHVSLLKRASYGEPAQDYGYSRAIKDTKVCALTDFMSVHFHLHLDIMQRWEYAPHALLHSLAQAIKVYKPHSFDLHLKHGLIRRRAMVHLDHLLSLWPKIFNYHNCVRIGTFQWLIDLMGEDKMTDWELRYYVSTGQVEKSSEYGNCESPEAIRDAELAQLRYHAKQHHNINVMAEIYGENTAWEYGDEVNSITRRRTPVTEFWPNLHIDMSHYELHEFVSSHPSQMPLEHFDDEALKATQNDRPRRTAWLDALHTRDVWGESVPPELAPYPDGPTMPVETRR